MNWTKENIEFVEKAIEVRNKGYYIDSKQLCDKYNEILSKNRSYTSCGSCLRAMVAELEQALNRFKKQAELSGLTASQLVEEIKAVEDEIKPSESVTEEAQTTTKEDENKAAMKAKMAKVRSHRKVSNK